MTGATLLAPIAWGTTYITITELLPDDRPLLVATMRVVPSGIVLLVAGALTSRWRPRGSEWWRTAVLAMFNFGIFFPLLIAAVYRLPGGVAAVVEGAPPSLTGSNIAGFAYPSLIGTALAFMLWFNGIRRLPAAAPPLLGLAGPVTGAVLGWTILGQSLSLLQLVGFAVTLGAIAYGASMRTSVPAALTVATSAIRPLRREPAVDPPRAGGSMLGSWTQC